MRGDDARGSAPEGCHAAAPAAPGLDQARDAVIRAGAGGSDQAGGDQLVVGEVELSADGKRAELGGDGARPGRLEAEQSAALHGHIRPAAQGAEDVASHADGGGNQHQQSREPLEGVGDGAEGQPGEEVTTRGDQEGGQALADGCRVRPHQRAEARADTAQEVGHRRLGGSIKERLRDKVAADPIGSAPAAFSPGGRGRPARW